MNERRDSILLALLNSGAYQHEWKNNRGMGNRPERDSAAARAVVATCLCIDRAMGDIELAEMNAVESFRCEKSHSGEHSILRPNGACTHCGKTWNGTQWLKK